MKRSIVVSIIALGAVALARPLNAQEESGSIAGVVLEEASRRPLPGAAVRVRGTAYVVMTGTEGRFVLGRIPAGRQTVEVTYLGYRSAESSVDVAADTTVALEVVLQPARYAEEVTVVAEPILEGQARALNQQQNAPNIVSIVAADQIESFPDRNSAEAIQRLPGVLLQRDQGEGRYVVVRGTEARLNYTALDGEQIPAPEGDVRLVALDVVPADALASIQVAKTLTPDMDADAIGGAVNLVTRIAPAKSLLSLQAGFGYNEISDDIIGTGALSWGQRFDDGRWGLLLAGSLFNTDRGSENFEVSYDDGELEELENRHYTVNRRRAGVTMAFDNKPSDSTDLVLRGNYYQFDDQEYRRRVTSVVPDGELVRELKDRFESQTIWSGKLSGSHLLPQSTGVDWRLSYSSAEEDEPRAYYSTFLQEDVEFAPNVGPDSIDPNNIQANPSNEDLSAYLLDDLNREANNTRERDLVGSANISLPLAPGERFGGVVRFGAKWRDKHKERDNNLFVYDFDGDLFLVDYPESRTVSSILGGRYAIGLFQDAPAMRRLLFESGYESERDPEEDVADYDVDETLWAGYGMGELFFGEGLSVSAGLRYEYSDVTYRGNEIVFDDEGDFASLTPRIGGKSYGELLPMINVRWRLDERTNLRAAATRSLARPNYVDLTPSQLVLQEDSEIERGNPELDPTKAWNFDLMFERYFSNVGALTAGVFYKSLEDYIYQFRFDEDFGGSEYEVTQPLNGEGAELLGAEVAFQAPLKFLPSPFDGLGVYANYTWTDSEATFPDREGDKATLPGQAQSVANLALFYEKGVFSGRLAWNYSGEYIEEVGQEATEDLYIDSHNQLDLAMAFRISKTLQVYGEVLNLTDEPFRAYIGTEDRPVQEEYYSWWGTLGVRLTF